MDATAITQLYLMYVVVPLWLASGLADWLCHRRAGIEWTTGPKESVIHLMMLAEVGVPLVLALVLEINALIILVMITAFLAHEATSLWDLRYASAHREVGPIEQHVHDYLAVIPFMAMSFVFVLNWGQVLSLFGAGDGPARFALELRREPLPAWYVAALLAAALAFAVVPFLEELWRGLRARQASRQAAPAARRLRA